MKVFSEDQFHRGKADAFGAKQRDGGMIAGRRIEVADKVRYETEKEIQALIEKPDETGFCGADSSRARTKLRNFGQMCGPCSCMVHKLGDKPIS